MLKRVLILLLIASTLPLFAQEKLSLDKCIELAFKNNEKIQISYATFLKSKAARGEVSSMFYPKLTFNAAYTRLSDVPDFEINVPIFPAPITVQESILNNYSLKLGFIQPLFTGFKLSSLKNAAGYKSEAAELDYNAKTNQVIFDVLRAYYNVMKASSVEQIIDKNINGLSQHLEDTKAFLENGLVTYNDYLKLQVELSKLKLRKIDASNAVKLSKNNLLLLIGLPPEENMELEQSETKITNHDYKLSELKSEAYKNRPELKSIEKGIAAADEYAESKKAEYYPNIYLFGNFYYSRPNQRYMPLKDEFNETWDAGISLQWELWNWGGTSARVEQANQDKFIAEKNKTLVANMIETEVLNAYLKYESELQKVNVNEEAVSSAKENYRLMDERYKNQLATGTELVDAETMLLDAEINLYNARIDQKIAEAELKKVSGVKLY